MDILIVFGSTYGNTEDAAYAIAEAFEGAAGLELMTVDLADVHSRVVEVSQLVPSDLEGAALVVLGASTWDFGELQADWDVCLDDVAALDWRGKRIALFGQGDQFVYEDTYMDALGTIAERLEPLGARRFGSWPAEGYGPVSSRALRGDHFVGLALDEDNQADQTRGRILAWVRQLAGEVAADATEHPGREAGAAAPPSNDPSNDPSNSVLEPA